MERRLLSEKGESDPGHGLCRSPVVARCYEIAAGNPCPASRGEDRAGSALSTGCELVDSLGVDRACAVAAEVVDAKRVRDVDDDVHSAADCSDDPLPARGSGTPVPCEQIDAQS